MRLRVNLVAVFLLLNMMGSVANADPFRQIKRFIIPEVSVSPSISDLKIQLNKSGITVKDGPRNPPPSVPPAPTAGAPVKVDGSADAQPSTTPLRSAQQRIIDQFDPRVYGGVPASINNFPWQVVLIAGKTPDDIRSGFCGGSLIAYQWVVTAAHCLSGVDDPSLIDIVSGSTYPRYQTQGDRVKIASIYIHPQFNADTFENDIALLKLERPVKLGEAIRLPSRNLVIPPGSKATVSGWGAVVAYGPMIDHLLKADVPIVSNDDCRKIASYGDAVKDGMLCAGYRQGGVDACQGDSGGPLMSVVSGVPTLVGIVSWGKGCALREKYGVYTRVTSYVGWIQSTSGVGAVADATK
jgi:secreted trypsin-like serine protease